MRDPMQRLNIMLPAIESLWQQQRKIDQAVIEQLIERQQTAQGWGQTLPAWRIVEGSIVKEASDASDNA